MNNNYVVGLDFGTLSGRTDFDAILHRALPH